MSRSRPTVALFDVGGVLVDWDGVTPLVRLTGGRLDPESARRFWLEFEPLRRFETGRASARAFAEATIAELRLDIAPAAFLREFTGWARRPFEGALELVRRVRGDVLKVILSNTNPLHWRRLVERFDLTASFDAVFASHLTGLHKPDPGAYLHVMRELGHPPAAFFYVDDNRECVDTALQLGMHAIRVRGVNDLEAALQQAGCLMSS
jgi:glucose-1-phosphatase